MQRIVCNSIYGILVLLFAAAMAMAGQAPPAKEAAVGTLTGQFLVAEGKPMATGVVSLFNAKIGPAPGQGMRRIPDSLVVVDTEGRFTAEAPIGRYYLAGRPEAVTGEPGPPRPDEKVFWARSAKGEFRIFVLKAGGITDAGTVSGAPSTVAENITAGAATRMKKTHVTLEGSVKDEQGEPIAGVYVMSTGNPKAIQPEFISDPTGEDGGFRLMVPAGKVTYLMARDLAGSGSNNAASSIAFHGGKTPKAVQGKPGEVVKDIDIILPRSMGKTTAMGPDR